MKNSRPDRLLAVFMISCMLAAAQPCYAEADAPGQEASEDGIAANDVPGWPQGPAILSDSAIVVEVETGTVLYAKNIDEQLPPSSSVKIMTCLVALENSRPEDEVTINETGMAGVTDGGANISCEPGEVFTMEQCLYAIMLASANDVALQVAEHVGGSQEHFVKMMNDRAKSLGCSGTHFSNPTGLTEEGACTTAHDLAIIIQEAFRNRTFRKIASTVYYSIPPTNVSAGERSLTNAFLMIDSGSEAYYAPALGGKEGYTNASGSVLVCMAEQGDMTLACAVMRGRADETVYEAAAIMNHAFSKFRLVDLGADEFNVSEGGIVCIPADASESEVVSTDTSLPDGTLERQYTYHDVPVGSATAIPDQPEDDTMARSAQKNIEAAEDFTRGQATIAYIAIAAAGFLLFGWLLRKLLKVLGKK